MKSSKGTKYVNVKGDSPSTITINLHDDDNHNCVAELTQTDVKEFVECGFDFPESDRPWYFFNRLYTHNAIRNRGFATEVMQTLVTLADDMRVNIVNAINPYGDLNMAQLENFYVKYGFQKVAEGVVIRLCK